MPVPSSDATAEKEALALLLGRYRAAHSEYLWRKEALRFIYGMGLFVGPFWLLLILVISMGWFNPPSESDDPEPTTYLMFLAVVFVGRLIYCRGRVRQSRKRIQRGKDDLDLVGYVVMCDQNHPAERKLVLTETPPAAGKHIVFSPLTPIDFAEYDGAFRA